MQKNEITEKEIKVTPPKIQEDINLAAPGKLRVIKRNGKVVAFENEKIQVAVTKAFLANEGGNAAASERIHEKVGVITSEIMEIFSRRMPSGGTLHIEEIQDQVELQLMRKEEYQVARSYILYREERAKKRGRPKKKAIELDKEVSISVTKKNGETAPLDVARLSAIITDACEGLDDVDPKAVLEESIGNLYDGVSVEDMRSSLIMTARTKVEKEPNYSFVTARILMDQIRNEALEFLGIAEDATYGDMQEYYPKALLSYIDKGIELDILNPELKTFNLKKISQAIDHTRDNQFTYLGLQTLYDRYFIHSEDTTYELPQVFFMRVAMGLAMEEENREERAIQFYNLISSFDYMS